MQLISDRVQKKFVVDLEDLQNSTEADDKVLFDKIIGNTMRYHLLFCRVIDKLLPEPSDLELVKSRHDVLDVILHQRTQKNIANQRDGNDGFPEILMRR